MQKSERKTELIVLLLIIAAICGLLRTAAAAASKFVGKGIGPMAFPQVILIMMLLLSLARLVFTLRYLVQNRSQQDTSPKIDPRVWATYILIIVYAALWNVLGFSISTFVYFIAQAAHKERCEKCYDSTYSNHYGNVVHIAADFKHIEVEEVIFDSPCNLTHKTEHNEVEPKAERKLAAF